MRIYLLALALSACGADDGDPANPDGPQVAATGSLEILSPSSGTVVAAGEEVHLSVSVTAANGNTISATTTWEAPGWTQEGADLWVTDLPIGTYDLVASADVDGELLTESHGITVEEPPEPIPYTGVMSMDISVYSDFGDFDLVCAHRSLDFILDGASFSGSGICEADFVGEVAYALDGTVSGGQVSGELSLTDTDDVLVFDGTKDDDEVITASFDDEFANEDGSARLYGSFTASP